MSIEDEHILLKYEDELFIRFVRDNDGESFRQLYKFIDPVLFSMVQKITADVGAAEDITQYAWLRIIEEKSKFNLKKGKFLSFIFTIAKNSALNWKRNRKNEMGYNESYEDTIVDPEIERDLTEVSDVIRGIISRMRNKNIQDAILMYYFGGLRIKKIAYLLDTSEMNVKNWLKRGREILNKKLTKAYDKSSINEIMHLMKSLLIQIGV